MLENLYSQSFTFDIYLAIKDFLKPHLLLFDQNCDHVFLPLVELEIELVCKLKGCLIVFVKTFIGV